VLLGIVSARGDEAAALSHLEASKRWFEKEKAPGGSMLRDGKPGFGELKEAVAASAELEPTNAVRREADESYGRIVGQFTRLPSALRWLLSSFGGIDTTSEAKAAVVALKPLGGDPIALLSLRDISAFLHDEADRAAAAAAFEALPEKLKAKAYAILDSDSARAKAASERARGGS
jgi:hypothetical protein